MPAEERHRPLLVALTGGVASGKTLVSDHLARKGVPIVDTDVIAREIVEPGRPGLDRLVDEFGPGILDERGRLDRRAMREAVFSDPERRKRLEALLHPLIEREARRQIAARPRGDYVVVVVPLLVESGLFGDADRVVVVDVPEADQIRRLVERDGVEESQARAMLDAQASREARLQAATDVIPNESSIDALLLATDELHERLVSISRSARSSPRRT